MKIIFYDQFQIETSHLKYFNYFDSIFLDEIVNIIQ